MRVPLMKGTACKFRPAAQENLSLWGEPWQLLELHPPGLQFPVVMRQDLCRQLLGLLHAPAHDAAVQQVTCKKVALLVRRLLQTGSADLRKQQLVRTKPPTTFSLFPSSALHLSHFQYLLIQSQPIMPGDPLALFVGNKHRCRPSWKRQLQEGASCRWRVIRQTRHCGFEAIPGKTIFAKELPATSDALDLRMRQASGSIPPSACSQQRSLPLHAHDRGINPMRKEDFHDGGMATSCCDSQCCVLCIIHRVHVRS
mmetsp:Transcript_105448/g.251149  ORF Transcript_105448/g.251149 Transcript_105448/m.251149 type:complete len:255 (-) Transcript_105448:4031-4795(-)